MNARVPLDEIKIGSRVRTDMGDLDALAKSMQEQGLLHPVVITKDCLLVAGHRRLEAARHLGWAKIETRVVNVPDLLKAERDENQVRKDFTPTEAVAIGRLIEEQEGPKAMERAREGWQRGARITNTGAPESKIDSGGHPQVADVVGPAVGMSRPTYLRAKEVVKAAERDPEKYGDLPHRMDEGRSVLGAHQELRRRQIKNGDISHHGGPAKAQERRQRVQEMAGKGYTRDQMAAELGVGRGRINDYCKELGVNVAADVIGKPRKIDSNRVISETVTALEGLVIGVGLVEVDKLDPEQVEHWATSLSESLRSLNRLAKQLKEMARA